MQGRLHDVAELGGKQAHANTVTLSCDTAMTNTTVGPKPEQSQC